MSWRGRIGNNFERKKRRKKVYKSEGVEEVGFKKGRDEKIKGVRGRSVGSGLKKEEVKEEFIQWSERDKSCKQKEAKKDNAKQKKRWILKSLIDWEGK